MGGHRTARAPDAWFVVEDDARGRWTLGRLLHPDGRPVPAGVGAGWGPLPWDAALRVAPIAGRGGLPVDMTFTVGGVPVVEEQCAERLAFDAGGDLTLVPVTVVDRDAAYFAVEVVSRPGCLDLASTRCASSDGRPCRLDDPDRAVILEPVVRLEVARAHRALRPAEAPELLLVSAAVAVAFDELRITGVRLTPLRAVP